MNLPIERMFNIFDRNELHSLRPYQESLLPAPAPTLTRGSGLLCSTCQLAFDSFEEQRKHFHLDQHLYNFRKKIADKINLSAKEFIRDETLLPKNNNSPSEHSHQSLPCPSRVFMETSDQILLSFHKDIIDHLKKCRLPFDKLWIYVLFSAGHVAAAVFENKTILAHKTFHRYTIRAKRGTQQSIRDSRNSFAKSAGAKLRRYNEAALIKETQTLLRSWSPYIKKADRIFLKCSKLDTHVFLEGKPPLFEKCQIQKISILTNHPTFKEIKRIHALYSIANVHGSVKSIENKLIV